MALSKKAAKHISDIINDIECAYIGRMGGDHQQPGLFISAIDRAALTLADVYGIELVGLADARSRLHERLIRCNDARPMIRSLKKAVALK